MKKAIKRRYTNEPVTSTPLPEPQAASDTSSCSPEIFYTPNQFPSLKRKFCQTPKRIDNFKKLKVKNLFIEDTDYSSETDDVVLKDTHELSGIKIIGDNPSINKVVVAEEINIVEAGLVNCSISKTSTSAPKVKDCPINTGLTTATTKFTTSYRAKTKPLPYILRPRPDNYVDVLQEIMNRPSKIFPMTQAELRRGLRL